VLTAQAVLVLPDCRAIHGYSWMLAQFPPGPGSTSAAPALGDLHAGPRARILTLRLPASCRASASAHDWFQARDDFDVLLSAKASAGRVLGTAFSVVAPLAASVVSALFEASQ
jgi:hypothetical protein